MFLWALALSIAVSPAQAQTPFAEVQKAADSIATRVQSALPATSSGSVRLSLPAFESDNATAGAAVVLRDAVAARLSRDARLVVLAAPGPAADYSLDGNLVVIGGQGVASVRLEQLATRRLIDADQEVIGATGAFVASSRSSPIRWKSLTHWVGGGPGIIVPMTGWRVDYTVRDEEHHWQALLEGGGSLRRETEEARFGVAQAGTIYNRSDFSTWFIRLHGDWIRPVGWLTSPRGLRVLTTAGLGVGLYPNTERTTQDVFAITTAHGTSTTIRNYVLPSFHAGLAVDIGRVELRATPQYVLTPPGIGVSQISFGGWGLDLGLAVRLF